MPVAPPPEMSERTLEPRSGVTIGLSEWRRGRAAAVLIAPGFFRSRRSPMLVATAERLAAHYDAYVFDFRGHGTSTGRYSFGRREGEDFGAALTHVREQGHERVAVVGFSMGGTVAVGAIGAIRRLGADPGIAALVTVSSPTEVARLRPRLPPRGLLRSTLAGERHRLPRISPEALLPHRLRTLEHAASLAPTPLLVLHNEGDWLVPHTMGEELFAAAHDPRALHLFRNRGRYHADALVRSIPGELFGVLEPFLALHLGS